MHATIGRDGHGLGRERPQLRDRFGSISAIGSRPLSVIPCYLCHEDKPALGIAKISEPRILPLELWELAGAKASHHVEHSPVGGHVTP